MSIWALLTIAKEKQYEYHNHNDNNGRYAPLQKSGKSSGDETSELQVSATLKVGI